MTDLDERITAAEARLADASDKHYKTGKRVEVAQRLVRDLYRERRKNQCEGFQWVGQSFEFCDGCSQPFWEHTHDMRSGEGPFSPMVPVLITDEEREACRRKWDRNFRDGGAE